MAKLDVPCPLCHGTGYHYGQLCIICKGTGMLRTAIYDTNTMTPIPDLGGEWDI